MNPTYTITATEPDAGTRLDKFLPQQLAEISRARFQALIEGGAVLLIPPPGRAWSEPNRGQSLDSSSPRLGGGRHLDSGHGTERPHPNPPLPGEGVVLTNLTYKVKVGDTFLITVPQVVELDLTPSHVALDIVYEDDDILVINKPAGMTVHPAAGTREDTLVHALLGHCGSSLSGIGGVARPGIVHRIDKDTSGLLAVAKNDAAHQHLSSQLKSREMKRRYVAFVWGVLNPREGTVDAPIARHPRHRKQMAVVPGGRDSVTHYETAELYRRPGSITPLASKVLCDLDTGRTHQIRVHLTHMKCPIIGDPVYGASMGTRLNRLKAAGTELPEAVEAALTLVHRQALHAQELVLIHPKTNEFMEFSCPLPADLVALESALVSLTN